MLTPKVKKSFNQWYLKTHCQINVNYDQLTANEKVQFNNETEGAIQWFDNLNIAFKFGIYQDYFWKEHKIWITIRPHRFRVEKEWVYALNNEHMEYIADGIKKTEKEARLTAIKEASKLAEGKL